MRFKKTGHAGHTELQNAEKGLQGRIQALLHFYMRLSLMPKILDKDQKISNTNLSITLQTYRTS